MIRYDSLIEKKNMENNKNKEKEKEEKNQIK